MRKIFLLALFAALVMSCQKDSEGDGFSFNGNFYSLIHGYYDDYPNYSNEFIPVDINLCSNEIIRDSSGYRGIGDRLVLRIICPKNKMFASGKYTFGLSENEFILEKGTLYFDFSFHDNSGNGQIYKVTGGSLNLQNSNNHYSLSFTLVLDNGLSISGQWYGKLLTF